MFNRELWDRVYEKHLSDAPWLSNACFELYSPIIDFYLPDNIKGLHILDYGCGNGKIAWRLHERGADVDMAEISQLMIEQLELQYPAGEVGIFEVEHPSDLSDLNRYDVVLTWMLFCNINPDYWESFLDGFCRIIKPGGTLIVGGWDCNDPINNENHNIVVYTEQRNWPINDLKYYIDNRYSIVSDDCISVKLPFYEETRLIRCYDLVNNGLI